MKETNESRSTPKTSRTSHTNKHHNDTQQHSCTLVQEKNVGLVRFELCADDDEGDDGDRIGAADIVVDRIGNSPSQATSAASDASADAGTVVVETIIIIGRPPPSVALLGIVAPAVLLGGGNGTVDADESSL